MSKEEQRSPWYCDHAEVETRRRRQANGVLVAARQCLRCGTQLGCVPKRNVLLSQLPAWDESLSERWREQGQRSCDAERQAKDQAWWDWYDGYLLSPEWRSLRSRVFARAKGVCEGCGTGRATQVHHLTYQRVGHEMLFDLVAVCDACHAKIHPEGEEAVR